MAKIPIGRLTRMLRGMAAEAPVQAGRKLIGAFRRPKAARGLFGKAMANRARKHGIIVLLQDKAPGLEELAGKSRMGQALASLVNRLGFGVHTADSFRQIPKGFKGVVVNAAGAQVPRGVRPYRIVGAPTGGIGHKLREAQVAYRAGVGPRAIGIKPLARRAGLKATDPGFSRKLHKLLRGELGPRYILKDIYGAGSEALPTEASRRLLLGETARTGKTTLQRGMAQVRRPLKPATRIERWIDKLVTRGGRYRSPSAKGTREYRIHALGGKVVPGATLGRGTSAGVTVPLGLPGTQREARRAEQFARQALARMPKRWRGRTYGFDVGIDRAGKPFLIEMNPADLLGASGYAEFPPIAEAMAAAVKGQRPFGPAAVRAAGTVGAGAIGLPVALRAAQRLRQDNTGRGP
jgi:hypothetical protein